MDLLLKLQTLLLSFCYSNIIAYSFRWSKLNPELTRRKWLKRKNKLISSLFISIPLIKPQTTSAIAELEKNESLSTGEYLGVKDGLLADCPHNKIIGKGGAGCTSSQDDTPGIFAEPWDYSDSNTMKWEGQMKILIPAIQLVCNKRGDAFDILKEDNRYLRVLFIDGKSGEKSIAEFYFTPNDTTVQFRIGTLNNSDAGRRSFSLSNLERSEMIRKQCRFTKLPVLRNRTRRLFFGESNLDSFGPGWSESFGPPEEVNFDDLKGMF